MRKVKTLIIVFLVIALLSTAFPFYSFAATTPDSVNSSTATERINTLIDKLVGKYFTTDGKEDNKNDDDRCKNSNVIASTWFKNLIMTPDSSSYMPYQYSESGHGANIGWSCFGFACYAQWYIFAQRSSDDVVGSKAFETAFSQSFVQNNVAPGDILRVKGHSMIYISSDSSGFTVLDNNWGHSEGNSWVPDNLIRKHTIAWSWATGYTCYISRPKNSSPTVIGDSVPGKPFFTNIKDYYSTGATITLSWSPTINTTHYNIWIHKYDYSNKSYSSYEWIKAATSGLTRTLPDGRYKITLQSYNSNAWNSDHTDYLYTENVYYVFVGAPLQISSVSYNSVDYVLYDAPMTWTEAKSWCENNGGHLVDIADALESNAVAGLLSSANLNGAWIGATDEAKEGVWKWTSGEVCQYTNWNAGEPNNDGDGEDYACVMSSGKWNDRPNQPWVTDKSFGFIFELDDPCANGHDYGAWTKLNDTQHQRVCSRNASHVEIAPHTWDAGTVTFTPTCKDEGMKTFTCSLCGATKTETLTKDPANHKGGTEIRNAKEATCGKAGYTGDTYCKGCDTLLASGETILATGKHTWNDGVVTTAPTYTTPGEKTFTCTVCSATRTEVIDPIPQPADPDAVITVATVNAQPGKTVDVTVDLTEYAPMSYLLLGLDYNKTVLTLNSVKNGGLFDTLESGANLLLNAGSDIAAGGNLLTLTFTVSEDAEPGDYTVTVTCKQCYNNSEEPLLVKVENGKITVLDVIVGDVNDDEVIDGRDLIRLRKYLANLDEETGESTVEISAGADCTGDGIVDGRDLIRLRKYLANLDENTGISTVELG